MTIIFIYSGGVMFSCNTLMVVMRVEEAQLFTLQIPRFIIPVASITSGPPLPNLKHSFSNVQSKNCEKGQTFDDFSS